MNIFQNNRI